MAHLPTQRAYILAVADKHLSDLKSRVPPGTKMRAEWVYDCDYLRIWIGQGGHKVGITISAEMIEDSVIGASALIGKHVENLVKEYNDLIVKGTFTAMLSPGLKSDMLDAMLHQILADQPPQHKIVAEALDKTAEQKKLEKLIKHAQNYGMSPDKIKKLMGSRARVEVPERTMYLREVGFGLLPEGMHPADV